MLREALASVEHVRNANVLEVIIVDDGSSKADTTRILGEVAEPGHSGDRGYNEDFETCQGLDVFQVRTLSQRPQQRTIRRETSGPSMQCWTDLRSKRAERKKLN